jgi:hypothetical protein
MPSAGARDIVSSRDDGSGSDMLRTTYNAMPPAEDESLVRYCVRLTGLPQKRIVQALMRAYAVEQRGVSGPNPSAGYFGLEDVEAVLRADAGLDSDIET